MSLFTLRSACAQNTDSLRLACMQYQKNDTVKINQLIELSKIYRERNLDTSLSFSVEAHRLSKELNFKRWEATALNCKGLIYKDMGKLDSALYLFNQSVVVFRTINRKRSEANGYNNIGLTWDDKGNQAKASESYKKALAIFESLADYKNIAYTYTNIGQSERQHGNYLRAIDMYLNALKIYEKKMGLTHTAEIGSIYNGLGIVYEKMEKYEESVTYFKKSLEIKIKTANMYGAAITRNNLADVYNLLNQLNLSKEYSLQALHYFRSVNYSRGIAPSLLNLGSIYNKMDSFVEALKCHQEALELTRTLGYKEGEAITLTGLAEIHLKQNNLEEALRLAKQSLKIANENNLPEPQQNASWLISRAYIKQGDFKNGYQYYENYITLRDSIFNKSKLDRLYSIEKEYEIARKQGEINLLEQQNKIKELSLIQERYTKYFLLIALILVLIAAVFAYLGFRLKTKLIGKLRKGNEEIQRLNLALEIRVLRSQMDPHFVFNALNGLQHFLSSQPAENSINYLSKVSRLVRLTLQNASRDWVKLYEELEILKLYLQVEQYRFPDKFEFDFIVDPATEHEKVPFLVIQPYVENAVLHGLLPRSGAGGKLIIRVKKEHDLMRIMIEDNGVGRGGNARIADPMFTSMGSGLARERLTKLSLQLGMLMDAEIEDLKDEHGGPAGTHSILTFELQTN